MLDARRPEYAVRIERGVAMTTSDGVRLRGGCVSPAARVADADDSRADSILEDVHQLAVCDDRRPLLGRARLHGRDSGHARPIRIGRPSYPLVDERRDGLDTLDWLKRQPWFDGRLGMWGGSAFGYTQWVIADRLPSPPTADRR